MNIHLRGGKSLAVLVSIIIFAQLCITPVCANNTSEAKTVKSKITTKNKAVLKTKTKSKQMAVKKKTTVKKKTVKKSKVKVNYAKKKIKKTIKTKANIKAKPTNKKIIKPAVAAIKPIVPVVVPVLPAAPPIKSEPQAASSQVANPVPTSTISSGGGGGGGGGSSESGKIRYTTFTDPATGLSIDYPASWNVKQEEDQYAWSTRFYYPSDTKTEVALVAMVVKTAVDPNIDLHADNTVNEIVSKQKASVGTFEVSGIQKTSMLGGKAVIIKACSVDIDQTSTAWQQIWFVFNQHLCCVTMISAADKLAMYSGYYDTFVKSIQNISPDVDDASGITFTTYKNNDLGITMLIPQSWGKTSSDDFNAVSAEFMPSSGDDDARLSVCKDSELYAKVSQATTLEDGFNIIIEAESTEMTDLFICDRQNLTVNGVKMYQATKIYFENGKQYKEIERIALANEVLYDCRARADISDKYRGTFLKCLNSLVIK